MKKTNPLILLLIVFSIVATSCNKTWLCECKDTTGIVDVVPIKSLGKMGAKNVCNGYEDQNNANGARQICSLK